MDKGTSTPRPPICPTGRSDADIDRAIAAAVANAAFDGIVIEPDEQALIRRSQRGEISHEEFLRQLRELAVDKAKAIRDGRHGSD